jgi:RNA polymerase sigma factor (TIGR02999 family)
MAPISADDSPTDDQAMAADWAGFLAGQEAARDRLYARCYAEFRAIAHQLLKRQAGKSLYQTTEVVNEAAMRLLRLDRMRWQDRGHFLAMAARVMRRVLIDESRRDNAGKRSGIKVATTWLDRDHADPMVELERLDTAMADLAAIDPERARIVELRFFAGLTIEDTARALDCSENTVKRRWRAARLWLLEQIGG